MINYIIITQQLKRSLYFLILVIIARGYVSQISGLSLNHKYVGVAGTTGFGTVSAVGGGVSGIAVNDTVLVTGKHTWSDKATVPANSVVKISTSLPAEEAANLPAAISAWALLNNFNGTHGAAAGTALKAGDVVVQSHGESAVGLAVTQLGRHMGLKVVSVGGSGAVAADIEAKIKEAGGGPVKLAISSGSGKTCLTLLRSLAVNGTLVVYNGVVESLDAAAGITVPVASAIFQNTSVRGFDYCSWAASDPAAFQKAVASVVALTDAKKLSLKSKVFPSADFLAAISLVQTTGAPCLHIG